MSTFYVDIYHDSLHTALSTLAGIESCHPYLMGDKLGAVKRRRCVLLGNGQNFRLTSLVSLV